MKKTFLIALAALAFASPAVAEETITVGTAGVTGVYYPAGGAICTLVNRVRRETGVRCAVESTGGSINNLEAIRKGDIELGIVQSDLLYHAWRGDEYFSSVGADKNLRVLFSLHAEPFTVVARRDAGIHKLDDLKGKRVYLGTPGSGTRVTMEELMIHKGWTNKTFAKIIDVPPGEQVSALCSGKIDAMIFAGGHPNGAIQQATTVCTTRLVDVSGPAIDAMIRNNPFYTYATSPGGMYAGNPHELHTFGVEALLVASTELDDATAYIITKSVFDNIDDLKMLHPVLATLSAKHMMLDTYGVPLHAGAMKYYKEKNLIQ